SGWEFWLGILAGNSGWEFWLGILAGNSGWEFWLDRSGGLRRSIPATAARKEFLGAIASQHGSAIHCSVCFCRSGCR
ncbi:MAG: hypothetical protein ACK56J_13615, partial [Planctomycetota bacterium]